MPVLIGCFVPTKGAMKKETRHNYTRTIDAPNRKAAGAILTAHFYSDHADKADDYFDVKLCDDRIGLSRPAPGEWDTTFTWNKNTGEIEPISPSSETPEAEDPVDPTSNLKSVIKMPTNFRAAVLALFGPVESITKAEYNQVLDLVNDDGTSFARELAEAISRSARILALSAERQTELLDAVRAGVKQNGQWTDFKKFIDKWLDTPADKRGAAACGNIPTPAEVKPAAEPENVSLTFEQKIAVAINAPTVEFDEVTPEILSDATNQRKCEYPAFIRAHKVLTYIQPTLEKFSDRLLAKAIRSVDFNEDKGIVACRRAVLDYLGVNGDSEEESVLNTSAAADVLVTDSSEDGKLTENAAGNGEPGQEVGPEDTRALMSDREIEICHPINALLSGYTNVMGKEEADGVVTCTGHLISEILALLLADITATEFCLSPEFSDEEIHHVATSILDAWSDNKAKRQIVALDAITELRTELPAPVVIEKPVIKMKPHPETEEIHAQAVHPTTSPGLTYRQQLTIAAIQGLCANPACFGVFDEIAEMAITLANATDRDND